MSEEEFGKFYVYNSALWFLPDLGSGKLRKLLGAICCNTEKLSDGARLELGEELVTMFKHLQVLDKGQLDVDGLEKSILSLASLLDSACVNKFNQAMYKFLATASAMLKQFIQTNKIDKRTMIKELGEEVKDDPEVVNEILLTVANNINREIESKREFSKYYTSKAELARIEQLSQQEKISRSIDLLFNEKSVERQKD